MGFYKVTDTIPPRFLLVLLPTTLLLIYGLLPKQQKWFVAHRNIKISTFLHTIRIPIEITLYGLYCNKMIPELMTFEGRNFDILFGLTAPIVGWLFLMKKVTNRSLLVWNFMGLFLVLFIYVNGILSAELPFQQFAFEQSNRAITYFPFILLSAMIVPIVIWTHISDIILLRKSIKQTSNSL
ncbi:MAG TPA: hypothetical protein P5235_07855 [Saprospiraceae bacterium]|nr:hypothetical protein [Saprospiraceae bacterium]